MLLAIAVMMAAGIGALIWSMAPQPTVELSRAALDEPSRTIRMPLIAADRFAWLRIALSWIGRIIPMPRGHEMALKEQLSYTGMRFSPRQVLALNVVCAAAGAAAGFLVLREFNIVTPWTLLLSAAIGWILPNLWITGRMKRRQRAIVRLLPEVIDLLSLCIGAGLDFLGALNKVVALKAFQRQPLIEELSMVLQEIKLGKRRFEALKAMAKRVNMAEVSSFTRTLVQADRMGTPIGEVLSVHSEDIRFERFQRSERAALRAPIKILLPLIFFIMPCVAIIVGGPILLQFMNQNPFGR